MSMITKHRHAGGTGVAGEEAAAITLAAVSRRRPQSEFYDPTERIIEAYKHIEALSIAILPAWPHFPVAGSDSKF